MHCRRIGASIGAEMTGLDLSKPYSRDMISEIRALWLEHKVLTFPDQDLTDDDLERFSQAFGPFGDDPFIAPIPGRKHIIAVQRRADEKAPIFAETWHTDWSFQKHPPAGTCLYGVTIPPSGGDTLFADQEKALADMPDDLRRELDGKLAIHSARNGYAPSGLYGTADKAGDRSMDIRPSEHAMDTQLHPVIRTHPETGRDSLFGCAGYIIGFHGLPEDESRDLLMRLYHWQTRPDFQYRHKWHSHMLVLWDNRCLLHMATGGYQGHDRLLHRTTIADVTAAAA